MQTRQHIGRVSNLADRLGKKSKKKLRGDFDSHVQGIPCQVLVELCVVVKGSHSYNAQSDMDYYGYHEVEFILLDRKGYRAEWLEKKLTPDDIERIEIEVLEDRKGE